MAHTNSTGSGLPTPDVGDAQPLAAQRVTDQIDAIDRHVHGAAPGQYPPIPSSGLAPDATLDMLTQGLSNLGWAGLVDKDSAASPPANGSVFRDGATGDLWWRNGSGADVQVTSGSALATTGNGFTGDYNGGTIQCDADQPTSEYRFYFDEPNTQVGALLAAGHRFLRGVSAETIANYLELAVDSGWAAAATGSKLIRFPAWAVLDDFVGDKLVGVAEVGTWTPEVWINNVQANETTQLGTYLRVHNHVFVDFRVIWDTGSTATGVEIRGLPYPAVATAGAINPANVMAEHPFSAVILASPLVSAIHALTADGTVAGVAGTVTGTMDGRCWYRAG